MGHPNRPRKPDYSVEYGSWFIPLTQGVIALVDTDMVPTLAQHNWYALHRKSVWYAVRNVAKPAGGQTLLLMHRVIMSPPDDMMIDHRVHHDLDVRTIDNRRNNLRTCTNAQNQRNRRPQAGFSSRFKGVHWDQQRGKWCARIKVNGKKKHLDRFVDEIAAARAYDAAAREHFGAFALVNFPIERAA